MNVILFFFFQKFVLIYKKIVNGSTKLSVLLNINFGGRKNYFVAVLIFLFNLQNKFLKEISDLANNDKSVALQIIQYQNNISKFEMVDLIGLKEEHIIALDFDPEKEFLSFAETEIDYGKSYIKFDHYMIENMLMRKLVWNKKYFRIEEDSFEEFIFSGEVHFRFEIIEKIEKLIGSENISQTDSEKISVFECHKATNLIYQIEIVFLLLNQIEKVDSSLTLIEFAKSHFPEKDKNNNREILELFPHIKICQSKSLYESFESVVSSESFLKIHKDMQADSLPEKFDFNSFIKLVKEKLDLNFFHLGLKRFIHRYLLYEASNIKPEHQLKNYLAYKENLWDRRTFLSHQDDCMIFEDILPDQIQIKHTICLSQKIQQLNQEKTYSLKDIISHNNQQDDDEEEEENFKIETSNLFN